MILPKFTLDSISTKGNRLPNRYILHGLEGWGKTSFAAQFPNPIFLQSKGETGLETLIDANQLPETPHFPECKTWEEMLAALDFLATENHTFKTLVIDTVNGSERLCHEYVCRRDFGDDWTDKGFLSYNKGYEVSLSEIRGFLGKLDDVRAAKRMTVFLLCHTKVKNFKNPDGPDYDRYQPDMHEKTWGLVHKWADVVLFGAFSTTVVGQRGKEEVDVSKRGKGTGGQGRVLYTSRRAAWDAKNRLGLGEEIDMGNSPAEAYQNFKAEIVAAHERGKAVA